MKKLALNPLGINLENRQAIAERLKHLNLIEKQVAFCYSICWRMVPNYRPFFEKYKWGDMTLLNRCVKDIELYLLTKSLPPEYSITMSSLSEVIPGSEQFPFEETTYAQMAASVIYYTMDYLNSKSLQDLSWVPMVAIDTIDLYQQDERILQMDERRIIREGLMDRELRKQNDDFHFLRSTNLISAKTLEHLRQFNNNKSNIDLPRS